MNIIGKSECTASQMAQYLISKNPNSRPWALEYAKLYIEEGEAEGVRGDGAWYQSCKETGNFKFDSGTAVTFDQNNFCGLGVTKKGMKGHSFETPRLGIRAQIQHLKAYATTAPLKNPCIDPRYKYVTKGCAPRFEDLAGKWAVPGYNTNLASSLEDAMNKGIGYGFDIIAGINKMKSLIVTDSTLNKGDKQMSNYTLKTNFADKSNYGSSRSTSSIKYIVWHYTANDGDTDEANGKYFNSPNRNASAHYFVDDDSITQSVPDNYVAWSVGGNRYSNYKTTGGAKLYGVAKNANTLNIELCDTQKNGKYNVSDKTLSNAIALTKDLMKKYNIPIENVIRHFDVTGKSCPAYYVDEVLWNEVKNKIQKTLSSTPISQNLYRVRKSWADASSQTGAYSSLENAKKNCKVGYSVFDSNGNVVYSNNPTPTTKMYHRVQTGAYKNKSGAIALQNKLKASGFDAIVKEVGGLHKVQIGAYSDVKNAEAMLKKVKAKGYSAFISYS